MTASKPLDGLKILVVEDEFLVAMDLGNIIQTLGGEVLGPVGTVSAAIELLEKHLRCQHPGDCPRQEKRDLITVFLFAPSFSFAHSHSMRAAPASERRPHHCWARRLNQKSYRKPIWMSLGFPNVVFVAVIRPKAGEVIVFVG